MAKAFKLAALLALAACSAAKQDDATASNSVVCAASQNEQSHVEVDAAGTVARILGVQSGRSSAHEGFLLRVACAAPVVIRVEANTSFTGTFALRTGQAVRVRGEYETDPRGGVIHWTHRDPRGRHPDGFIEVNGTRYQ